MNHIIFGLILALCFPLAISAQSFRGLDRSPLDIAYFPDNFAHDRSEGDEALIKVIYSRPQKKDREIFGKKVPYGKVWRLGANEAAEIKVYKDIKIGNKSLKAGTYSLFAIPGASSWEIIINSDLDYWGAYSYNQDQDVLRVKAKSSTLDKTIEAFSIQFRADGEGKAVMMMAWDQTLVEVPIKY